ncbi:metalloregulator ArsR/SmtB family transcription factor [Amycolatopsis magusensis]|uniref:DNA-binding transcriptional ArsR family regulator n=1 Tax=Amycolatopsis magusensis TaxID=882444 RepID=A0ABS4PXL7_9PSEU|nr:metalloregulator ArsR/SmtB family transcription factor [Amycolatopsis magusensis]MBP2184063.1 DNA-binding transcriptional ArsR family regulator [Amycolatopsis magusensis]
MTIELGVAELAATRFAISPLSETVAGLRLLAAREQAAHHAPWVRWARGELRRSPLELPWTWPLLVHDRAGWPNFLVPAPKTARSSLEDDLAALAATGAEDVRASLRRVFGDQPPALAEDPVRGLRAVAAELRVAHDRLIAPHWSRIRALLEADVTHRAHVLAAGGARRLFADLHPSLSWSDGRVTAAGRRPVRPGPGGLVLMPLALGPSNVLIKRHTATQTTVRYPVRGVGTLWTAAKPPASTVVRLLGRARANLLAALRSPATTTDLAAALGVTPSAVSHHLRVLHENGLVTRERTGRTVHYALTSLGRSLLSYGRSSA